LASTRVYILAKELGVKSGAIVKKCQAEGLDVKNHMSVISAGLAATIREWFSEGENITTIETAAKVDLQKVRVKKKKKAVRKKKAKKVEKEPQAVGTVAEEAPGEELEGPSELPQSGGPAEGTAAATELPAVVETEEFKPAEEEEQQQAQEVEVGEAAAEQLEKVPAEEPPKEPEPILPAGPIMEKPEPAKLSGPQVVRIEAPEPEIEHRHRRRPKRRYDEPITERLMYTADEDELRKPTALGERRRTGKRHKDRTHGRRREAKDVDATQKVAGPRWRQIDLDERRKRLDEAAGGALRGKPSRKIAGKKGPTVVVRARPKKAVVSEPITVKELSAALAVKTSEIISKLMEQGVMATANQTISSEVAELVALEFDTELVVEQKRLLEEQIRAEFESRPRKNLTRRAVVAAMLGHVDHGKTSLLDKIRSTQVATREAGGITQHIGASQVSWDGKKVTFLDTPGHEAFTAMRARGANMTDVVVLVVAADDGVMPQTIEAIAHSRAANVPIIVALNKIDLPGCDINRVYAQLAEQELTPTEWGGQTDVVKTSAVTGEGIDQLLEHLDLMGEILELKADPTIPASGWVVEARLSAQLGPVATLLIKEGQLKKGDVVLAGSTFGRIKQIKDSFGRKIKAASSSMPVEVTGLNDVPQAGDTFYCLDDINRAKAAAEENRIRARESSLAERTQITLDNLFSQIEAGKTEELNIIIRADVQGSVDVLKKYLSELSTDEVKVRILHAAPGGITEGDVVLAEASNAIIIGFNVVPDEHAARIAETKGVEIRLYNVIYRITEDLQKSMAGLLEPEEKENIIGRVTVRATFKVSRVGTVAGCYVSSGVVNKQAKARLIRDNIVVKDNLSIESLKHFKDDVREVKAGLECGIKIAGFDDVKLDDVLEFYEIVKVARTLR